MLDFEAELKKFHPSLEVDEVEEAIYKHGLTDITDLLVEIEKDRRPQRAEEDRGTEE
ncbi:MAG TPA: hypothetical protein H9700_10370 [Candidatus Eisenbergiella intestinipullorum]|nr:hypothetical protein [Candidatus Eisenbergiella intestinipullorum]